MKVKNGKVQEKNNLKETPNYWNTQQTIPLIVKEAPGEGYKHFLKKRDILKFIDILPEWKEISRGLNAIVLSQGCPITDGYHDAMHGVINICAWNKNKWIELTWDEYELHRDLYNRLEIKCEKKNKGYFCKFDEKSIKAYQLLHVFLHELGHHYDQMTTKRKIQSCRGEHYAEEYALKYEKEIFNKYFEVFGY